MPWKEVLHVIETFELYRVPTRFRNLHVEIVICWGKLCSKYVYSGDQARNWVVVTKSKQLYDLS